MLKIIFPAQIKLNVQNILCSVMKPFWKKEKKVFPFQRAPFTQISLCSNKRSKQQFVTHAAVEKHTARFPVQPQSSAEVRAESPSVPSV